MPLRVSCLSPIDFDRTFSFCQILISIAILWLQPDKVVSSLMTVDWYFKLKKQTKWKEKSFRTWLVCSWHQYFFTELDKHFIQQTISSVFCATHNVPATDRKGLTSSCIANIFSITYLAWTTNKKTNQTLSFARCLYLWYKYLHYGQFQATYGVLCNVELGKKWAVAYTLNFSMHRKPQNIHSICNSKICYDFVFAGLALLWITYIWVYVILFLVLTNSSWIITVGFVMDQ